MKQTALVTLFLLVFANVAAAARADEALSPEVRQCISINAPKVETAVVDLNQAVDFLVMDVCAEPLAADQTRSAKRTSEQQMAHWKKMCDEVQTTSKTDTANKEAASGYAGWCSNVKFGFLTEPANDDDSGYTIYGATASRSPAAVALAARLLLDLRLSHQKGRE